MPDQLPMWVWAGLIAAIAGQFAMFLVVLFVLCAGPKTTTKGQP